MLKIILLLFFAFGSCNLHSQEKLIYSGYYVDSFRYRSDPVDIFRFELYKNGFTRLIEDERNIMITDLIDLWGKNARYTIWIDKYTRTDDYDSFKTIYVYKDGNCFKSVHLQKLAFRLSGGCFRYDNKRASYWYQTGFSTYEYDVNGSCTKQIDYDDIDGRRDTALFLNSFLYDSNNRIRELRNYRGDTMYQTIRYKYAPDYKKTETFNYKNELVSSIEEFSKNEKLIRLIEYHKYGGRGTTETNYFYNENELLLREERFYIKPGSKDLVRIRTYIYD